MAKVTKKKIEPSMSLEEMVNEYGLKNEIKKECDHILKDLNPKIKVEMKSVENGKLDTGMFTAVYSERTTEVLNLDQVIQKLKALGLDKAIKTVETVDEDILETMLHDGTLDAAQLKSCYSKNITQVLTVKKSKAVK